MKAYLNKLWHELYYSAFIAKAIHTFWQAFIAVWIVSGLKLDKSVLIAAVAAGLSALKSFTVSSITATKD